MLVTTSGVMYDVMGGSVVGMYMHVECVDDSKHAVSLLGDGVQQQRR